VSRRAVRAAGRAGASGRPFALAALLVVQTLCAVFFAADVAADLSWNGLTLHAGFEAVVALALAVGVALGAVEMRRTLERSRRADAAAQAASGAFAALMEERFEAWGLTPAEAEVALFALKGLDVAEIAAVRGAAAGTVRAQLAKVYAKAGVSGRGQLVSSFIEALLDGPLPGARRAAGRPEAAG